MKTLYIFISILILTICNNAKSQEVLTSSPQFATDSVNFKTINVNTEQSPVISIVFTAETKQGEALFGLEKQKIIMTDLSGKCEVLSLEQLSKNKALNIAIVIDHSASMGTETMQANDLNEVFDIFDQMDSLFSPSFTGKKITHDSLSPFSGLKKLLQNSFSGGPNKNQSAMPSPIDSVKKAVIHFIAGLDHKKDSVSIIGFAEAVDIVLPLTRFENTANSVVNSMQLHEGTAVYDGIMNGLLEAADGSGTKAVVVLTDGGDNSSQLGWQEVVYEAQKEKIPVYCIGIGQAEPQKLKLIAAQTGGSYFYAKSTGEIDSVYTLIRHKIQAQYKVTAKCKLMCNDASKKQFVLSYPKQNSTELKTLMPVVHHTDKEKTEGDEPGR